MTVTTDEPRDTTPSGKTARWDRKTLSGGSVYVLHDRARFLKALEDAPDTGRRRSGRRSGMTYQHLADVVGCSKGFVGTLATGEGVTVSRVLAEAIAAAVGVGFGELFVPLAPSGEGS